MKKEGFTLVELLAVIVILAIILGIAVPTISKIVDSANRSAARSSALIYVQSIKKFQTLCTVDPAYPCLASGNYEVSDGIVGDSGSSLKDFLIPKVKADITYVDGIYLNDILDIDGDIPKSGYFTIDGTKVVSGEFIINQYKAKYDGSVVTITGLAIPPKDTYAPVLALKSTDTASIMHGVDTPTSSFFDITWAESETGTLNCTDETASVITNTSTLKIGNHTVTCSATGNTAMTSSTLTKNITITFAKETIDSKEYYLVYDAEELSLFRDMVNSGNNTINAKLMNNINLRDVQTVGSLLDLTVNASGTVRSGNTFTSNSADPNISFSALPDKQVCSVTATLTTPLVSAMEIQLFYMNATLPLAEANSVKKTFAAGSNILSIPIPCNKYTALRIDPGSISGVALALSDITYNNNWVPIGRYTNASTLVEYKGIFDGNNKNISNLFISNIDTTSGLRAGFFGTNSGTIKNLSVFGTTYSYAASGGITGLNTATGVISNCTSNVRVHVTADTAGGMAGTNNGNVANSTNNGMITSGGIIIGGLVGYSGSGSITNSINNGVIKNTAGFSGGIVGYFNDGTLTTATNNASISGGNYVGGIAGVTYYGTLTGGINKGAITGTLAGTGGITGLLYSKVYNSYNEGTVTNVSTQGTGGIAGIASGSIISSTYNKGIINGCYDVGGIAGYTATATGLISDSYNVGSVKAVNTADYSMVGGIAGDINIATVTRTYNTGAIQGYANRIGGITGALFGGASLTYSYNIGTVKYNTTLATVDFGVTPSLIIGNQIAGTYSNTGSTITLANLGSAFKADTNNINNGYPILIWQN